ncbi:hypothetical protein CBR56_29755 [Bacillus thuringiensis]|uniref:hypothetical protein n=1 Tax=Bacillus tropicus TaxID=2026188 RepID=UPI000B452ABA|nr:hypothetical protein [Bacillus tropicus]MED3038891.1 hypothetical protein [Bacillus tropicus]OTX88856.1 hypothetical protein BK728_04620 [Bacillus thuringiensis serovar chanpaisis]PNK22187.1 hypothetical protein CBR56_29755 [Bacillus thuringiensis]
MISVDEHTQIAMEVVAQTLLHLLEALLKLLEGKGELKTAEKKKLKFKHILEMLKNKQKIY